MATVTMRVFALGAVVHIETVMLETGIATSVLIGSEDAVRIGQTMMAVAQLATTQTAADAPVMTDIVRIVTTPRTIAPPP